MSNTPLLAIVDDQEDVVDALKYLLEDEGFEVEGFTDSKSFLQKFQTSDTFFRNLQLVILDYMIDENSGEDILREVRQSADSSQLQVIMMTIRNEEFIKTKLLEAGADDFCEKSTPISELAARIRARLRNLTNLTDGEADNSLASEATTSEPELILDIDRARVGDGESVREVRLTLSEVRLLRAFLTRKGRVVTPDIIEREVKGWVSGGEGSAIPMAVSRLRKKLAKLDEDGSNYWENRIQSSRGMGWMWR